MNKERSFQIHTPGLCIPKLITGYEIYRVLQDLNTNTFQQLSRSGVKIIAPPMAINVDVGKPYHIKRILLSEHLNEDIEWKVKSSWVKILTQHIYSCNPYNPLLIHNYST